MKKEVIESFKRNDGIVYVRDSISYKKMTPVGMSNKLKSNPKFFPEEATTNLYGKKLRGSSFDHRPYTYISEKQDGKNAYDGSEVKLINASIIFNYFL